MAFLGGTKKTSDPIRMARDEIVGVGASGKGRLERNLMSEAKVTGRLPGWLANEIPHTAPIVWYGNSRLPFDHIFDEMRMKDPDLASFDMRMRTAILALPRTIVPADESGGAKEAVELCRKQVNLLSGGGNNTDMQHGSNQWLQFQYSLLENVWSGTSFVEPNWNDDSMIDELVQRPMHAFGFRETESGGAQLSMRRIGRLEDIPPGKIIFARNSLGRYPWGEPMAVFVYLLWKGKIYNFLDWALFLERWAKPVVDVEYDTPDISGAKENLQSGDTKEADAREEKASLVADRIWGNGKFVHNDKSRLKLHNQNVSGGEQYQQFYLMCARQQSRLLLNEITTTGLEGFGSHKKAEITNNVGANRMRYYAPSISSVIESTIFRWICQIHLPRAPVPRYLIDVTSAESRKALFDGVEASLTHGQDVAEGDTRRAWGTRKPFPGEAVVQAMARETMKIVRGETEKET